MHTDFEVNDSYRSGIFINLILNLLLIVIFSIIIIIGIISFKADQKRCFE